MTRQATAQAAATMHRNGNGYHEREPEDFHMDADTAMAWAAEPVPTFHGDVDPALLATAAAGFHTSKPFDAAAFKRKVDPMPEDDGMADDVDARAGPTFTPMGLGDLLAMPPKEWMIDQILSAGDLGMIYGAPGSGKTFVAIDLVFAACLGKPWADRFGIAHPLRVAYAAGEGFSGLRDRFAAAAQHYGVEELPGFMYFDRVPQLARIDDRGNGPPWRESSKQFVYEWTTANHGDLDLLIVDTLHSASLGAEENSATDTAWLVDNLKRIATALHCAVLVIHHTNKGGTAERGSSALRGAMDVMIHIETAETQTATRREMTCAKLKDGDAWKKQSFDLIAKDASVYVSWNEPGTATGEESATDKEELLRLLRSYPEEQFTVKALIDATGKGSSYTYKLLGDLVRAGKVERFLLETNGKPSKANPWRFRIAEDGHTAVTVEDGNELLDRFGL